jgi:uncharacterized protein (DUF58 family)
MEAHQRYLDPETLAKLNGLDLKARLIVEGYVSGLHKSPFRGFSIEFAEHREYVPGDDLRYVDWKVFGKSDRIYLKQYEEETNFACWFLLDTSESMSYRSDGAALSKLDYARHVAAALSYLVLNQQDAVGLATFDRGVRSFVRAAAQPTHLKQLCHVMEADGTGDDTALGPILHELAERIRQRGVVVLLSDLFDDVEALKLGLKHLRHRRQEVIVLQVIDPAEQDFPFADPTLFKGLEGLPELMTEPRSLREAYQREFEHFLGEVGGLCRDLHMDHVLLRTDQPLDLALRTFLSARARRRQAAR